MGLDMYLHARKYIEKLDWEKVHADMDLSYNSPEAQLPNFKAIVETADLADVATDIYGAYVTVTAAYWRKANQIHGWFVRNIQGGNDNCGEYYVSHEKLESLLAVCRHALRDKTVNALVPTEGFFFGGTEIDEYYWGEVERTVKVLDKIIKNPKYKNLSFYYTSSW